VATITTLTPNPSTVAGGSRRHLDGDGHADSDSDSDIGTMSGSAGKLSVCVGRSRDDAIK
jgi:hypothetical protein